MPTDQAWRTDGPGETDGPVETNGPGADEVSRLLLQAVVDYAIYMLDAEGHVVSWNLGAEAIKGYRPDEIIGTHYSSFFIDEDRDSGVPQKALDEARRTGRYETEGWRLRKDGSRFWAMAVLDAIRSPDGKVIGFAKITRDMTAKRLAQEKLAASERQLRLLVSGVTDYALYMLSPEGLVTNWNAGAARIKGFSAEEAIGEHFGRFYTEEDRAAGLPERALETARQVGRFEAEGWRLRKDGTRFWANAVLDAIHDETGELVGFAKITRDMSERRAAELALRESERQFRLLVEGVADYALYMLDPNGVVTNWNTGAQKIKGYTADQIVGSHFSVFYTEEDRRSGLPETALRTARETGRFEIEGWRLRCDGTRFWANAVLDAIRDENGELIGYAKITRDITDRLETQKRLEEIRDQLFQSQKMEAVGQLTGGVAHDFNNLLTVILGGVDMAARHIDDPKRALKLLEGVAEAAGRGASLTRQLLAFSRRQSLTPEPIALGQMLPGFVDLLERSMGGSVQTTVEVDGGLAVMADVRQLELALLNVCLNARDAMPDGGRISITARERRLTGDAQGLKGDFVALSVTDTGEGISPAVRARVFEPFFTTKEVGRGTGLGLSQAWGFAQQSGGAIELESEPGRGTTVTVLLPKPEAAVIAATPGVSPPAATLEDREVLVVEDDPRVAELACDILREAGALVIHAADADEALEKLRTKRFDLVFSDITMPGRSGIELAEDIRREWPETPILLTSGYAGPNAAAMAAQRRVLAKPYSREDLTRALADELLSRRRKAH